MLPIQVFRLGAVSGFFMSEMVQPSAARLAEKDEELRVVPEKIPSQSIPRDMMDMNHHGFVGFFLKIDPKSMAGECSTPED